MAEESRRRLGRGLAALLGDAAEDEAPIERPRGQRKIRRSNFCAQIRAIRARPSARRIWPSSTASIREKGVIQPIVVRAVAGVADAYEIIAGERRWRAAQMASLADVPVVIHEADDKEALELAIIENVQRADLNAIEEAKGYERLGAEFGYSHSEIAKIIGKSRSHVANTIRLLNFRRTPAGWSAKAPFPPATRARFSPSRIPAAVARRIVEEGLTVRDVERLAQAQSECRRAKGAIMRAPRRTPIRARSRRR